MTALAAYARLDLSDEEKRALARLRGDLQGILRGSPCLVRPFTTAEKLAEAADWRATTTTPFGAATVNGLQQI